MRTLLFYTSLIFLFTATIPAFSQVYSDRQLDSLFADKGEICFSFEITDRAEIHHLTSLISIDNRKGTLIIAYANRKEFMDFLKLGYKHKLLPHPSSQYVLSGQDSDQPSSGNTLWNFYPTYDQYIDFMVGFVTDHPEIARLDTIGTSVNGRLLLAVKISDNPSLVEPEPQFFYTSSIHGDETTGYILMMHLIDHLLSGYGTDPFLTEMVNNTEIFINPLANPDGTYKAGNHTVNGAIRYNANGVDLNRNFPDPKLGPHPDGNAWQVETVAMMDYAEANHFNMSANFHGGAEVFNFPWDTWSKLHADDEWWRFVGREWADTVHKYGPAGYFTDEENGITNGYAWYELNGGRQDYMNYWHNCREVTVEISNIKLLPASQLINFWNYNYRSLLNYIRQSRFGITGIITDTVTDFPVEAKVFIAMHDKDNSEVYSRPESGFYARYLAEGSWNLTFSAPGYYTKTISGVNVTNYSTTYLDVQLRPLTYDMQDKVVHAMLVYPNPSAGKFRIILPEIPAGNSCSILVLNSVGKMVHLSDVFPSSGMPSLEVDLTHFPEGLYFLKYNSGHRVYIDKLLIRK